MDGQLSKRLTGLWRRRREWISRISKKFPGGPAELDQFGTNVGSQNPYIQQSPGETCFGCEMINTEMPMYVNGQPLKTNLDGMNVPVSMAGHLVSSGSAQVDLANSSGQALATLGIYPIWGHRNIAPDDPNPTDPNAPITVTTIDQAFITGWGIGLLPISKSERRPLSSGEIKWLRGDVERLVQDQRCNDFIASLIGNLVNQGIAPEGSNDILSFFDAVFSGSIPVVAESSSYPAVAYSSKKQTTTVGGGRPRVRTLDKRIFGVNPKLTVQVGDHAYQTAQPFGRDFYSMDAGTASFRGETVVHELIHLIAREDLTSHNAMAQSAYVVASIMNLAGDSFSIGKPPQREDYVSESAFQNGSAGYFDRMLGQACTLTRRPL